MRIRLAVTKSAALCQQSQTWKSFVDLIVLSLVSCHFFRFYKSTSVALLLCFCSWKQLWNVIFLVLSWKSNSPLICKKKSTLETRMNSHMLELHTDISSAIVELYISVDIVHSWQGQENWTFLKDNFMRIIFWPSLLMLNSCSVESSLTQWIEVQQPG